MRGENVVEDMGRFSRDHVKMLQTLLCDYADQ